MFGFGLLDWLKVAVGVVIGAMLATTPAFLYGRSVGVDQERLAAHNRANERITEMEKNNENFNNLSPLERCRIFMRDSGLPLNNCH